MGGRDALVVKMASQDNGVRIEITGEQASALEGIDGEEIDISAKFRYDDKCEVVGGELVRWQRLEGGNMLDILRWAFGIGTEGGER